MTVCARVCPLHLLTQPSIANGSPTVANQEAEKRRDFASKAKEAYLRGEHHDAKEFSKQAKKHMRKMKRANKRARDIIFQSKNPPSRRSNVVDLHRLQVKEAEKLLLRRMNQAKAEGEELMIVIVGKGNHSLEGAKIKPAVEKLCQDRDLRCPKDENQGRIQILLEDYEPEDVLETSDSEGDLDLTEDSGEEDSYKLPGTSNDPIPQISTQTGQPVTHTPPPSPPPIQSFLPVRLPPLRTTQSYISPPASPLPRTYPSRTYPPPQVLPPHSPPPLPAKIPINALAPLSTWEEPSRSSRSYYSPPSPSEPSQTSSSRTFPLPPHTVQAYTNPPVPLSTWTTPSQAKTPLYPSNPYSEFFQAPSSQFSKSSPSNTQAYTDHSIPSSTRATPSQAKTPLHPSNPYSELFQTPSSQFSQSSPSNVQDYTDHPIPLSTWTESSWTTTSPYSPSPRPEPLQAAPSQSGLPPSYTVEPHRSLSTSPPPRSSSRATISRFIIPPPRSVQGHISPPASPPPRAPSRPEISRFILPPPRPPRSHTSSPAPPRSSPSRASSRATPSKFLIPPPRAHRSHTNTPLSSSQIRPQAAQEYDYHGYDLEQADQPARKKKKNFLGRLFRPFPVFFAAVVTFCIPTHEVPRKV